MENNNSIKTKYDIGIVGYWYATNYGSVITYYALSLLLNRLGKSNALVDCPEKFRDPEGEDVFSRDFLKNHCNITPSVLWNELDNLNDICYDFMVGSDQVWTSNASRGMRNMFFLNFVRQGRKKIAYAPSFGNDKMNLEQASLNNIQRLLADFDRISIREEDGKELVENKFGCNADRVLDPVFLIEEEDYNTIAAESNLDTNTKYILAYILDPTPDKELAIKKVSEKYNLPVKLILDGRKNTFDRNFAKLTIYNNESDVIKVVNESDWIKLFKDSSFVVTDSHHGMAMAIIFKKDMICYANRSRGYTRFTSILNILGMMNILIETSGEIDNLIDKKLINYDDVYRILSYEKNRSIEWLKTAITEKSKKDSIVYKLNIPSKCTGCGTCSNSCPSKAISLIPNKDGFLNPKINLDLCSNCGLCTKKCPMLNAEYKNDLNPENAILFDNPEFKKIRLLATLLRDYNIKHIVLSPGGRDVPLVRIFEYNENQFILHRVTDERSAGYFAMGIATQLHAPVACICTSGTAASNYLPAVTEAYYTGIPVIFITADRYEVFHNIGEDQTIPQTNIYNGVVKREFSVPEANNYFAEYETRREIASCILETTHNGNGPVHINVPVNNISFGVRADKSAWALLPFIYPHILRVNANEGTDDLLRWVNALRKSQKILIMYGQNNPLDETSKKDIEAFASKYNCVISTDTISNFSSSYAFETYIAMNSISQEEFDNELAPDILITVGGKRLMNDPLTFKIRNSKKSIRHWSVIQSGEIKDFYFKLTSVIEMGEKYFFSFFNNNAGDITNNKEYFDKFKKYVDKAIVQLPNKFTTHYIQKQFAKLLPANSMLHLGVGQSFFDIRKHHIDPTIEVYCNMGTNGIDGCTSTFMGQCSVLKDKMAFLLVGDLSFFYDMNSIWNKDLNKNIRILLVNNNGSGLLCSHNLRAITSIHNTTAEGWVKSTGFKYMSANNPTDFDKKIKDFVNPNFDGPLLFEVHCDK